MPSSTLALAGAIALAAGAAYAHVGRQLHRRSGSGASRRALVMFAVWWYALALNITLVSVTYLLASVDLLTFEIQFVDSYLQRVLLAVSMVGLMHYLLYLLTGRDLLVPLAILYAVYFVLQSASLLYQQPDRVFIGAWRTDVVFERPEFAWMRIVSLGVILLPPVGCALWYFRLFFRVEDRTRKWRIALVSWAIIAWWGIAVVAGQRAALDDTPLQVVNRVLSLLAAFAVLAAYAPPQWAQRRLGVRAADAA